MFSIRKHADSLRLKLYGQQRKNTGTSWRLQIIRITGRWEDLAKPRMPCGAIRRRNCQLMSIAVIQRECQVERGLRRNSQRPAKTVRRESLPMPRVSWARKHLHRT